MYTCDTCYWWDFGLCDRYGKKTDEDDWCKKWSGAPEAKERRKPDDDDHRRDRT